MLQGPLEARVEIPVAFLTDPIVLVQGAVSLAERVRAIAKSNLLPAEGAVIMIPFGVVLVEWSGLTDDLMGNPGVGRVSNEMIDRLIDAYLPQ